ncbi:MAG TPA: YdcF family protein [Ilumatobacteraceae bacterium]|nr:YdcF family protein [Ilumatobacteraceae bacterium]
MSDLDPLLADTPPSGTAAVALADPTPVGGIPIARRPSWPRRLLIGGVAFMLLAISYYAVTLYQVHSTGLSDQARPVDAIVVMGAAQYDGRPSPQLAARLDHAADLWSVGIAKVMVVTGGNQPGDRFTEAEASANYLIERGVPAEAILQESRGHSSYASLDGVATLLHQRGLFRVLLVSDPFHSLRSRLIAQELGLVAYVSPTRTSPVQGGAETAKEMEEAAGIAVGRIIGFKRLLSLTG